jgi:hypothetical protein
VNQRAAAVAVFLAILAATFAAGFLLADHLNKRETVAQTYKPEIRTSPSDVVLETAPGAKPAMPAPTKPQGVKPVATVEVTVTGGAPVKNPPKIEHDGGVMLSGEPIAGPDSAQDCPTYTCPDIRLRMDLDEKDGQFYASVRTEEGHEVFGRFIPHMVGQDPRDKRLTVVGVPGGWLAIGTKDAGRWAYGAAGGEIDGQPYVGIVGGFAWR